jgi:hypothetical protein
VILQEKPAFTVLHTASQAPGWRHQRVTPPLLLLLLLVLLPACTNATARIIDSSSSTLVAVAAMATPGRPNREAPAERIQQHNHLF